MLQFCCWPRRLCCLRDKSEAMELSGISTWFTAGKDLARDAFGNIMKALESGLPRALKVLWTPVAPHRGFLAKV